MRRKSFLLVFVILGVAASVRAEPLEEALAVHVAKQTLVEVMGAIADEIGGLKTNFPQLKQWDGAQIFSDRIEYRREGKDGCQILIYAKSRLVQEEYQVGVYLQMKAFGKRAPLLKQTLLAIIAKHFAKIRRLHVTS